LRKAPILLVGMLALVFMSCGPAIEGAPQGNPEGFSLGFEYGVGGSPTKNVLDTARGTFTKDMIVDPPNTVKLSLGENALIRIRAKMDEIDFWSYPDILEYEIPPDGGYSVTPYGSYYFRAKRGSTVKELRWDDEHGDQSDRAGKLRELIRLIQVIIESTDEYESLPEPRGGYM
jgi:hypothetical protein